MLCIIFLSYPEEFAMGDAARTAVGEKRVATFVAGGERHAPGTLHGWDESLAAMEQGLPVRTTQMRLLDSHPARYVYDELVIEDGDERIVLSVTEAGFSHEASGQEWKKFARPFVLWRRGDLSERRVERAVRPDFAHSPVPTPGDMPDEADSVSMVTFVTNSSPFDAICGWRSADALLSMEASFRTTQMGFLDDPRVTETYDVVVIDDGDRQVEFVSDGREWVTDATDRQVLKRNNLFCLWKNGEFDLREGEARSERDADDMGVSPEETRLTLYAEFSDVPEAPLPVRMSPYKELVTCDVCRFCGSTNCPLRVGLILMGQIDEAQTLGKGHPGFCPYGEREQSSGSSR